MIVYKTSYCIAISRIYLQNASNTKKEWREMRIKGGFDFDHDEAKEVERKVHQMCVRVLGLV